MEREVTVAIKAARELYRAVFIRDGFSCVYCGLDILGSLDSFASSHLDHLKPKRKGGPDSLLNCVIACGVCNSMKGGWDPCPNGQVTADNFHAVVAAAQNYVMAKRNGTTRCSYVRDYNQWLKASGRAA